MVVGSAVVVVGSAVVVVAWVVVVADVVDGAAVVVTVVVGTVVSAPAVSSPSEQPPATSIATMANRNSRRIIDGPPGTAAVTGPVTAHVTSNPKPIPGILAVKRDRDGIGSSTHSPPIPGWEG